MSAAAKLATPVEPGTRATAEGLVAILLWSSLAALTTFVPMVPPFQLAAMTFALGTLVGVAYAAITRTSLSTLADVPAASWLLGVYGLLGYHACYFTAFRHAPAIEVNLVNYLWPLLIVLFSGLLPANHGGHPLRWWQVAGACLGFMGCALLLAPAMGSEGVAMATTAARRFDNAAWGYGAAVAAALIWSSYSVASRLFSGVPSVAVTGTCAATSIGAAILHLMFETTSWPSAGGHWLAIVAAGLGPVGLAFYLWDHAMKHGNLRFVGVASYATPLLSTLLLSAFGLGSAGAMTWIAALLISGGALLAAREVWDRRLRT